MAVVPDVLVVVAAGFAPKREGALVAGAAVLDDAAGAVVVAAENKDGVEAGAGAAAGAVVEAVDAAVGNNEGFDGAAEVAPEPPRLGKREGAAAAVVVAAVLAGVVVAVVEAGFAPKRLLLPLLLSAGLAAEAPVPNRDGDEVPPVEAANRLGFSAAPVEAGLAPKRFDVPELLAGGCEAGVEADPLPKRLELGCGVAPADPLKRFLACDPWPLGCWLKRLGVGLAESEGGAPAGVVDPRPPNIGFVGVACPADANKELPVLAVVDGVELAAGFALLNRPPPVEDAPPNGLAPVVELAPAAGVGVLEPPPNTLDGDAAGLFNPENRELAPPAGGVPVDAAPPNNEGLDEEALVVEAPPNSEEPAGFGALLPPKRPPPDAAGCPGVAALSFCALPKENPLEGAEDWLPNNEVAGVDEDGAPDVA